MDGWKVSGVAGRYGNRTANGRVGGTSRAPEQSQNQFRVGMYNEMCRMCYKIQTTAQLQLHRGLALRRRGWAS